MTRDGGHPTPLRVRPSATVNRASESRLLPSTEMDATPLDAYMARAHIAWARRYRPWLVEAA